MWLLRQLRDLAVCDVPMSIRDSNVSLSLRKVDYLILFEFCRMQKNSKVYFAKRSAGEIPQNIPLQISASHAHSAKYTFPCGAPFCAAQLRPNMLNMSKSASNGTIGYS